MKALHEIETLSEIANMYGSLLNHGFNDKQTEFIINKHYLLIEP